MEKRVLAVPINKYSLTYIPKIKQKCLICTAYIETFNTNENFCIFDDVCREKASISICHSCSLEIHREYSKQHLIRSDEPIRNYVFELLKCANRTCPNYFSDAKVDRDLRVMTGLKTIDIFSFCETCYLELPNLLPTSYIHLRRKYFDDQYKKWEKLRFYKDKFIKNGIKRCWATVIPINRTSNIYKYGTLRFCDSHVDELVCYMMLDFNGCNQKHHSGYCRIVEETINHSGEHQFAELYQSKIFQNSETKSIWCCRSCVKNYWHRYLKKNCNECAILNELHEDDSNLLCGSYDYNYTNYVNNNFDLV